MPFATPRCGNSSLTGTVTLSAPSGGTRIKVWTSATKGVGNEVSLPATYNTPADLPKTLYVEDAAASGQSGAQKPGTSPCVTVRTTAETPPTKASTMMRAMKK